MADGPAIDTSRPSVARVYDLFLGGKDNFEADRALFQQILQIAPEAVEIARENRKWLRRVVSWLVRDGEIDQFLDLGSGLPTAENTHQVAQELNHEASVVYVDNDPTVIAHGNALLEENDRTHFVAGDLTGPATILENPVTVRNLDFDRPVAVLMCLVVHHIESTDEARRIIADYLAAVPSGSYFVLSHACNPRDGSEVARLATQVENRFKGSFQSLHFRSREEIRSLLDGLEIVDPGLVPLHEWWPVGPPIGRASDVGQLLVAALCRKP